MLQTLTTTVLLSAFQPSQFVDRLETVDAVSTADDASVTAYDSEGVVIGTIEAWIETDGALVVYADYEDGFARYTIIGDRFDVDSDMPPDEIAARAHAMSRTLGVNSTMIPTKGVLACGFSILATVVATAAANPYGATLGGIATVCNCPKLVLPKVKCPDIW